MKFHGIVSVVSNTDDEQYIYCRSGVDNKVIQIYENAFGDLSVKHFTFFELRGLVGELKAEGIIEFLGGWK